jgi:DnaK suppressor protein
MAPDRELDLEAYRARLLAKRDELIAQSRATHDDRDPVALDQQSVGRLSRADAIQQQQMALELERRRQRELERIAHALERMETGEYGDCIVCGEPIAKARLDLDPAAATCVACASRT